jgi:hypothetical protein
MLRHAAGRVPVLIDVKTTDAATAAAILGVVRAADALDRVWFGFRSAAQVALTRKDEPLARCLGFVPAYERASDFAAAGAQALRVWEGHMDEPAAARLFERGPVWVTAGGYDTGRQPGDVTEEGLARIVARGAAAVLLNDPTLLTGVNAAS